MKVCFVKHDESLSWSWEGYECEPVLGFRAIYAPAGTRYSKPTSSYCSSVDSVLLGRESSPFCIRLYDSSTESVDCYVDILAPEKSEYSVDQMRLCDMDLDLQRNGGKVVLLDEDEFEANRVSLGYPDALVNAIRALTADLQEEMNSRTGVFGLVARDIVNECRVALMSPGSIH